MGKMTREEADEKATELLTRIGLLDKADSIPTVCRADRSSAYAKI